MKDEPSSMPNGLLEICAASLEDVLASEAAGARRVELNSAIALGGLTPSMGLIELVVAQSGIPVIAMCRPRPGGFFYSPTEFQTLLRDAARSLEAGARGIAFGVLNRDGSVDTKRCMEVVRLAGERETVFHRAFDLVSSPLDQARRLVDCGVKRVMTSGGKPTALEGRLLIRELVEQLGTDLEILAAGGVRPENLPLIVESTGVSQIHAGPARTQRDPSWPPGGESIRFDAPRAENGGDYRTICRDSVEKMANLLRRAAPR
jgi:copper homeostasis protein